jgi:hypothetical protein
MVTVPRFEDVVGRVVPPAHHELAGAALVVTVGVSSLLFHLIRLTREVMEPFALLFGVAVPLVLSVLLIAGGLSIPGAEYGEFGPRIGAAVDGEDVVLRVADNGPSLPEEEIRVLERGHETVVEHTSGLGLWLANWIVTESGGEIAFESGDTGRSVVTIRLPRTTPPG